MAQSKVKLLSEKILLHPRRASPQFRRSLQRPTFAVESSENLLLLFGTTLAPGSQQYGPGPPSATAARRPPDKHTRQYAREFQCFWRSPPRIHLILLTEGTPIQKDNSRRLNP